MKVLKLIWTKALPTFKRISFKSNNTIKILITVTKSLIKSLTKSLEINKLNVEWSTTVQNSFD